MNCNHRIVVTLYTIETRFAPGIQLYIIYTKTNDDDDDNNNNNNNNNNSLIFHLMHTLYTL